MLSREEWLPLTRDLDWEHSYVAERDAFPAEAAGEPWLPQVVWRGFAEPYRTTLRDYVATQSAKEDSVAAVAELLGDRRNEPLDRAWANAVKLHAATLPLVEFAAAVGNLRAARFARGSGWRNAALLGALDECRHAQIPLLLMHPLLRRDAQLDWTHRLLHTDGWVAIAIRHCFDEMLLFADPIEMAIATNFVFETGFTNLQFVGLSALAHRVGDRLFEKMVTSIQTDEARHAQIGAEVVRALVAHDRELVQRLVDKWFWRSWQLFAVVTGFAMDYLTPLEKRSASFKEFMEEWVVGQMQDTLLAHGLRRPWYWDQLLRAMDYYHHMVYASAYTYRATVWFDLVVPGPLERAWLRRKYPGSWDELDPVWQRVSDAWEACDPGLDFCVHGTAIPGFCCLCQLPLCGGTPARNSASVVEHDGRKRVFCSEPCRWIFEQEPGRYAAHEDLVRRVLTNKAPGNLMAMLAGPFGLDYATWGKDAFDGRYPWLRRRAPSRVAP